MNCTAEPLSTIVKDVIMSLAAIATAFAALWTARTAYSGLNTWKRELNEKVNIELERNILVSLHRIQTEFEIIRKIVPTDIKATFALLQDEMDKLWAITAEVEILWDAQIRVEVDKLQGFINTLWAEYAAPSEDRVLNHKIKFGPEFGLEFKKVLESIREMVKAALSR